MTWSTYVDAVRIDGRDRFYLQRVNDRLSGEHPVLRSESGNVAWYETDAEARGAAYWLGEPLQEDHRVEPLDLDAALAWTEHPRAEGLDYGLLMGAWHTLATLGVTREPPVVLEKNDPDWLLGEVGDKVHIGYDAMSNPKSTFTVPEWSVDELALLANTLREGLRRLTSDPGLLGSER